MKIKRQEINAIYSVGIVIINLGPLEAKLYFLFFIFLCMGGRLSLCEMDYQGIWDPYTSVSGGWNYRGINLGPR